MGSATMADVARVAGVSKQTVSRVINDHPNVSAVTRDRVQDAIERLDYHPHAVARFLASRRSLSVGVVCANLTLYGPSQLVRGVEEAAHSRGYFTSVASLDADDDADVADVLSRFFDQAFDAVILVDVDQSSRVDSRISSIKHLVSGPHGAEGDDFWEGDRVAVREATEHLIELGHRRIAHVSGPPRWPSARERTRGWREALDAAGLAGGPQIPSHWHAAGGYAAGQRLLEDPDVTAVMASSDEIALGVIAAYTDRGLSVPDDLSVVGYDNVPSSAYYRPPLTTVECDFKALGARYVDALDAQLGEHPPLAEEKLTSLVVRESTAEPPARTATSRLT